MANDLQEVHKPWVTNAMGNITRSIPVDPAANGTYTNENGFFIRAGTTGYIRYCPVGNGDTEYIEKEFTASSIFVDPEICRKIFGTLEAGGQRDMAEDIFVGFGV